MRRASLVRTVALRSSTALRRTSAVPRTRAARVAGAPPAGNPIPTRVREQVRERSGGHCELGASVDCTFVASEQHHRKRRRDGGHALSNVVDACGPCHRHAHGHPQQARERGWIVSAFAVDTALEPIRYGDPAERLTWFADDGRKHTAYVTPGRGATHGY